MALRVWNIVQDDMLVGVEYFEEEYSDEHVRTNLIANGVYSPDITVELSHTAGSVHDAD